MTSNQDDHLDETSWSSRWSEMVISMKRDGHLEKGRWKECLNHDFNMINVIIMIKAES